MEGQRPCNGEEKEGGPQGYNKKLSGKETPKEKVDADAQDPRSSSTAEATSKKKKGHLLGTGGAAEAWKKGAFLLVQPCAHGRQKETGKKKRATFSTHQLGDGEHGPRKGGGSCVLRAAASDHSWQRRKNSAKEGPAPVSPPNSTWRKGSRWRRNPDEHSRGKSENVKRKKRKACTRMTKNSSPWEREIPQASLAEGKQRFPFLLD